MRQLLSFVQSQNGITEKCSLIEFWIYISIFYNAKQASGSTIDSARWRDICLHFLATGIGSVLFIYFAAAPVGGWATSLAGGLPLPHSCRKVTILSTLAQNDVWMAENRSQISTLKNYKTHTNQKIGYFWKQIIVLHITMFFFNYPKLSNFLVYYIFKIVYFFKDFRFDKLKLSIFLSAEKLKYVLNL